MADHPEQDRSPTEVERVHGLSDATFAIALTLLVLQINLPELPAPPTDAALASALQAAVPKVLAYALSFLVIGRYWIAHRRLFNRITRADHRLVRLNLLFLAAVSFMPVPTYVLGLYGHLRVAAVFYAASAATTGLLLVLLSWYAERHASTEGGVTAPRIWTLHSWRIWGIPVFFLLSILLAIWDPAAVRIVWLLIPLTYVLPDRWALPWMQ